MQDGSVLVTDAFTRYLRCSGLLNNSVITFDNHFFDPFTNRHDVLARMKSSMNEITSKWISIYTARALDELQLRLYSWKNFLYFEEEWEWAHPQDLEPYIRHLHVSMRLPSVLCALNSPRDSRYDFAIVDSGANSCGVTRNAWKVTAHTGRTTSVSGFDSNMIELQDRPIVSAKTAVDFPDGTTLIVCLHEATLLEDSANCLLSTIQMRDFHTIVNDIPRIHGGDQCIIADEFEIPLILRGGLLGMLCRVPLEHEIESCVTVEFTNGAKMWELHLLNDVSGEQVNFLQATISTTKVIMPNHKPPTQ